MINQKLVDNIRSYGTFKDSGEKRRQILEKIGFRMGEKAEYAIITGCFAPEGMPHALSAFKTLLDRFEVNYTLLAKEYCCGWMPLGQPAVMAKNEEDIATSKELAGEFILQNFRQAEALGAKSIVLFCSACEPNYSNLKDETSLEVISYTELLDRYFPGGKLALDIDYYAGCYRFRRRITDKPLDLEPAVRVLNKIEGLRVNHLDNNLCCYIPPHIEQLTQSIKNNTIVTICTGCYYNLVGKLSEKGNYQVKMLPEILVL
ncbi:MAG: (Fe-S)-binding protein [Thermodesulfobacteriota bacterium]|nr:(Fe-S)-binding protein [Thermodesulfobacteriota bacterium]